MPKTQVSKWHSMIWLQLQGAMELMEPGTQGTQGTNGNHGNHGTMMNI